MVEDWLFPSDRKVEDEFVVDKKEVRADPSDKPKRVVYLHKKIKNANSKIETKATSFWWERD